MKRGEIYRMQEKTQERGDKPGFYVVVSRNFVAGNDDIATVVCAPIYSKILGLRSEVVLGAETGLPRESAIRCDFLSLMFKKKLTGFIAELPAEKLIELNRALSYALEISG